MSPIHEAVDGVVSDCSTGPRSPTGIALPEARLIQQLHDGPSQWMALALLHLDSALGSGRVVDARLLDHVRVLLNEALRSVRCVLDDWCDCGATRPEPLVPSLLHLGRRLASLTGLTLHMECDEHVVDPPAPVTAIVLHATQELLLNTCKHAPDARAEVSLVASADGFVLRIRDDGPGFDAMDMYKRHSIVGGLGLGAMPDQLAGVGGRLSICSRPGEGVQASICWPADLAGGEGHACDYLPDRRVESPR